MNGFERIIPSPEYVKQMDGTLIITPMSYGYADEHSELINHIFPSMFDCSAKQPDKNCRIIIEHDSSLSNGAYRIEIKDRIIVSGSCYYDIAAALWTLKAIAEYDCGKLILPCCVISDSPYKQMRGVHFYLPPSYEIDGFCRILDVAASLKYNAVILETGGGVEFDSHPEVNAAWRRFCREAREYPNGPQGLQASEAYWKDSTHVELANSDCLTKAELKRIADHCAMLGLEVIPEIQALSHAYYLTLAHREIAERPYERWPDSYCPSCDESYQLYFELAEEIIDVLHPRRVSIGHDEIRVLGECPRCKCKSGHELLADDINRLYDFYRRHGIDIMMWGEKLQRANGDEIKTRTDRYGRSYSLPATYLAAKAVPKDILMLDWYYSLAPDTEREFCENGFNEIFGNFKGSLIADWQKRSKSPNVLGAEVSTWCVPNEYEMGYNGWFEELIFSAMVLWRSDFCDEKRDEFRKIAYEYMPKIRAVIRGEGNFNGTLQSLAELTAVQCNCETEIHFMGGTLDNGIANALIKTGLNSGEKFNLDGEADTLVFFHAAENLPPKRSMSWYFLDKGHRIPARYAIDYDNGMCVTFDVELGINTGAFESSPCFTRPTMKHTKSEFIDDKHEGSNEIPAPVYADSDPWRSAAVYFTHHADFSTPDGSRTVYAYEWNNPYKGHKVKSVRFIDESNVKLTSRLFAVGRTVR